MCGRFVASTTPSALATLFDAALEGGPVVQHWQPSWNVAPTRHIPIVRPAHDTATASVTAPVGRALRTLAYVHWGLVPTWAPDRSRASGMINARAETVTEKPSFRDLLLRHRGVVPMDGYYEWRTIDAPVGRKRPYLCTRTDGALLATAALWTTWRDPQNHGALLTSCAIITVEANDDVASVHDRMPVLLDEDGVERWLHAETPPLDVLHPAPAGTLNVQRVSYAVNNARTDLRSLVTPVDEDPPDTLF